VAAAGAAHVGRHLFADQLAAGLVKTGGRLINTRATTGLLLAESHLTSQLFAGILRKVTMLPSPAG